MHFTVSPFGSAGDVFPFLGLALELSSRGHDVSFVTTGYFEESVRRHGLQYVELGTKEEFLEAVNDPDLWSQSRSFPLVFERIASVFRQHYELLAEQHARHPTIAISSCLGFGARLAQEKLGIPLVSVHLQPAVIHSQLDPPMLAGYALPRWFANAALRMGERFVLDRVAFPEINQFRAEIGLEPQRGLLSWWHSPQQNICLFPEWFAAQQTDWPPHSHLADFPLWDDQADQPLPASVAQFLDAGEAPIVFTPGSANRFGRKFFRAAVEACQRIKKRGILLTPFSDQVPSPLPDEVRHFDYVPLTPLLTRCAMLVHHGGVGTTAQGLAAGVPQLIMALAHDQFDNGARVRRLGVGSWMYPQQFFGSWVARRMHSLLTSDKVQRACELSAKRLSARNGISYAADHVERFVNQECQS